MSILKSVLEYGLVLATQVNFKLSVPGSENPVKPCDGIGLI